MHRAAARAWASPQGHGGLFAVMPRAAARARASPHGHGELFAVRYMPARLYRCRVSTVTLSSNWLDPTWEAHAHRWIRERGAALGVPVTGPVEQFRVRPWSVVLRVPTSDGWTWFKANTPASRYEAALVDALSGWAPGSVLAPLAVDTDRGWILSPHGGPTLREAAAGAPDPAR